MNTASASTRLTKRPAAKPSSAKRARPRHSCRQDDRAAAMPCRRDPPWCDRAVACECKPAGLPVVVPASQGARRRARPRWSALRAGNCGARRARLRRAGEQLWQTDGRCVAVRCSGSANRRSAARMRCGIFDSTLMPPHRHRRGRARDPRQLRGRAAPPRLRGRDLRDRAGGARGVPHAPARPRARRHRPRRRRRRRLHAVPRAARAVGDAADHLPVGARLRLRHRGGPARSAPTTT